MKPGLKLLHPEWFSQVIICAKLDPFNALHPAPTGRENEDRRRDVLFPPAPQNLQPVEAWKAKVKNDGGIALGSAEEPGLFTVLAALNHITVGGKALAGLADAERTGLIGYSMGGYGALITAGAGLTEDAARKGAPFDTLATLK